MKGGAGWRLERLSSRFRRSETLGGDLHRAAAVLHRLSVWSESFSSFLPSRWVRRAAKESATRQIGIDRPVFLRPECSISLSRSQTSLRATDLDRVPPSARLAAFARELAKA